MSESRPGAETAARAAPAESDTEQQAASSAAMLIGGGLGGLLGFVVSLIIHPLALAAATLLATPVALVRWHWSALLAGPDLATLGDILLVALRQGAWLGLSVFALYTFYLMVFSGMGIWRRQALQVARQAGYDAITQPLERIVATAFVRAYVGVYILTDLLILPAVFAVITWAAYAVGPDWQLFVGAVQPNFGALLGFWFDLTLQTLTFEIPATFGVRLSDIEANTAYWRFGVVIVVFKVLLIGAVVRIGLAAFRLDLDENAMPRAQTS